MSNIGQVIKNSKKIVIKVGSNVLSDESGFVNHDFISGLVNQSASLLEDGHEIIIVSSGAGIFGVSAIDKWNRRKDINYKQALCSIGQVELMVAYKENFAKYDKHVGQILLTNDDFKSSARTLNIRNAIFTLLDEGVIPIINENDSVSVDEIKIGDNDTLGALTSVLWNADLFLILSDIEGVYSANPKLNSNAKLLEDIDDIDNLLDNIDTSGTSTFGTGGIATKINAAKIVKEHGIPTIILKGSETAILDAIESKVKGTYFRG